MPNLQDATKLKTTSPLLERASFLELVHILRDHIALALQIILDRARKLRMRQPVRGARDHRQKTARQLVLAPRAALESLDVVRDAELDRLVVASLEMQAGVKFERAP